MNIKDYFAGKKGTGVLATADGQGRVNAAIYATPHFMADGSLAFVMRERLTYANLQENAYATYLFRAEGPRYKGVRLFLKKVAEEADQELIKEMSRRHLSPEEDVALGPKHLVCFKIEKALELVGDGEVGQ
ncbi:MAG: pyridoxamine 5'-phosphate oxidase [Desulfobulbaceae bacterium]|nr:MAG: pyridoxamine 5'-phosphate oxidase [Desulfobulbaceae bacterium]